MSASRSTDWKRLVEGYPWFTGEGSYPIPAYSEFMPAPRVGCNLYGEIDETLFLEDDPFGWQVSEIEDEYELRPGLEQIARQVIAHLAKFGRGEAVFPLSGRGGRLLEGNPFWSEELDAGRGSLYRERYVSFLPVALAKTQDYLGRVRWTLFGNSEQGPERAFWESFRRAPDQEVPADESLAFIKGLLADVYREEARTEGDLVQLGFRVLPTVPDPHFPYWQVKTLPTWTKPFVIDDAGDFHDVYYLLTFRPFSTLPPAVRARYLAGKLVLLPSPFSLLFWGMPVY